MGVVVIGQIARDLVLRTDGPPTTGDSVTILQRNELLGGKGANQAVGLSQLGVPVALIGVVGDDHAGASVLQQARRDGRRPAGILGRQRHGAAPRRATRPDRAQVVIAGGYGRSVLLCGSTYTGRPRYGKARCGQAGRSQILQPAPIGTIDSVLVGSMPTE